MTDEKKTPDEWCKLLGVRILDPDGWLAKDAPSWDEPITRKEFEERARGSIPHSWAVGKS